MRTFLSIAAAVAALSLATPVAQAHPASHLPLPYNGNATQVVTVVAKDANATTAILTAWQRAPDGWQPVIGPVEAHVGSQGIGQAREGATKTPSGVWTLTEAFGIQANDGTRLPYRHVGTSDWWVSDVNSPFYNTYQHCDRGTCPFNEAAGENLGAAGFLYNHAVVIDYNRSPVVRGAGSAFFLHITNGRPTAGCVAITADALSNLMRWLDPAQHPVLDIGQ